tara:strand:+ start:1671 stop:1829 length:159 start_codon:yes stop_codon:yes gene_type:complete
MIKLVYYCEEHDCEIEVKCRDNKFDLEAHPPKKCILTGAPIEDFYYDEYEDD